MYQMKRKKEKEPIITKHASKRIRGRLGLQKKNVKTIAKKAITHGLKHKEADNSLRKYLDGIFLSHGNGANIRVYHQKVFIFTSDYILITVLQLPQSLYIHEKISRKKLEEKRKVGG